LREATTGVRKRSREFLGKALLVAGSLDPSVLKRRCRKNSATQNLREEDRRLTGRKGGVRCSETQPYLWLLHPSSRKDVIRKGKNRVLRRGTKNSGHKSNERIKTANTRRSRGEGRGFFLGVNLIRLSEGGRSYHDQKCLAVSGWGDPRHFSRGVRSRGESLRNAGPPGINTEKLTSFL